MPSMTIDQLELPAQTLVGFTYNASLNDVLANGIAARLRDELASRASEISGVNEPGIFLVQIYMPGWTPDTPFTQVIGKSVDAAGVLPDGMSSHVIPAGTYLRFLHQGPESKIGDSYGAIHRWLPENGYDNRIPFDFEYWSDLAQLETAATTIPIHLPLPQKVSQP
jgi:predicted transcriptional regulator YdeE